MTTMTLPSPPSPTSRLDPITPDGLLKLEQRGLYELVDGQLIEKPMGLLSGRTAARLAKRLGDFLEHHPIGELCAETTFQCFPSKPNQIRRPDLAFITAGRVGAVPDEGHVLIRPDLAIEVVSPGDGVYDLDGKLLDYRSAGVPLTWVFNPAARIVRAFAADGSIRELSETDTLDGEDVLPGFSAVVGTLMPATAGRLS